MKKIFSVLLVCFIFLAFCSCDTNENEDITYWEQTFDLSKEPYALYEGNMVPDKETAIAIAEAMYSSLDHSQGIPGSEDWVPFAVIYDETNKIWCVAFGKQPPKGYSILGADFCVLISQEDGRVIKAYYEL